MLRNVGELVVLKCQMNLQKKNKIEHHVIPFANLEFNVNKVTNPQSKSRKVSEKNKNETEQISWVEEQQNCEH